MTDTTEIVLTKEQQEGLDKLVSFLKDPKENRFVLSGYSGCGKTTLVKSLFSFLVKKEKALILLTGEGENTSICLTATTNKAAENLSNITTRRAITIHSALALRVQTGINRNDSKLVRKRGGSPVGSEVIIIDEASYIDKQLLEYIESDFHDRKVIFIGDPAQLIPVNSKGTPVFRAGYKGHALTEVVRQSKHNPIIDLGARFRDTVNGAGFFSFKPDGFNIQHMQKKEFMEAIEYEFTRPDWTNNDSRVLGWTNACVIKYGKHIRTLVSGDPEFKKDDYVVCNNYLSVKDRSIATDKIVQITYIGEEGYSYDVVGNIVELDGYVRAFCPKHLDDKKERLKLARKEKELSVVQNIEKAWADLRPAYSCTINKSQGSTFDTVFIDLDDVSRCNNGNQIARMLYVAVTRARDKVIFTGDFC